MPTEKKIQAVADMTEWLNEATIVISADYAGLPVTDMTALRRALREKEVSLKVVKNNLAYIAAENAGKPELKEIIQGPQCHRVGLRRADRPGEGAVAVHPRDTLAD